MIHVKNIREMNINLKAIYLVQNSFCLQLIQCYKITTISNFRQ